MRDHTEIDSGFHIECWKRLDYDHKFQQNKNNADDRIGEDIRVTHDTKEIERANNGGTTQQSV